MPEKSFTVNMGVSNLPNQKHRATSKKGAKFTVMTIGQSGLGKTTFVNTLFSRVLSLPKDYSQRYEAIGDDEKITVTEAELEERKFKLHLTVVDTPGFSDSLNNNNNLVPILGYIEEQYANFLSHELRADRSNLEDSRIHVALYFIEPTGHPLTALDIVAMQGIGKLTNLIPVIAKADTLTAEELAKFKKLILNDISNHGINIYQVPIESDDEESTKLNKEISSACPYAIISSEETVKVDGKDVLGRKYKWGVAEVENDNHCDFRKLRSLLLRTHLNDIIQSMKDVHYEAFREKKLRQGGLSDDVTPEQLRKEFEASITKKEEEIKKRSADEVYQQQVHFQNIEDRMNKQSQANKIEIEKLQLEVKQLEQQHKEKSAALQALSPPAGGKKK